jgi:F420-0:gamma-glutamyl ligase-like protein
MVKTVARQYEAVAVLTHFWKPGEDYLTEIVDAVRNRIKDGDFVTISEKAVSTALGNIVNESEIKPSRLARFLAKYWMRLVWGYALGPIARLRKKTIWHIRKYPIEEGSAHKQVTLTYASFLQALMYGSEGGIDANNLPYSYVSLPLKDAQQIAERICERIKSELDKDVTVMIVDTDKTYSLGGFYFTHRRKPTKGIHSFGGFLAYIIGRRFKMKKRATPIAIAGSKIGADEALEIAEIANRVRGSGAGTTAWDMAERFRVSVTSVTWNMLSKIEHKPIVIVRLRH